MPADLTLPDDAIVVSSSLVANYPGLTGGRSELGVVTARLDVGFFYWSGTLIFGVADRNMEVDRGVVEGAIGAFMSGKSLAIPLGRDNQALIEFENASGDPVAIGAGASMEAAANGLLRIAGADKIQARAGALLSYGDRLYQCIHGGTVDLAATAVETLPEWPSPAAGTAVEFRDPKAVGIRPDDLRRVDLPFTGNYAGPYTLMWVENRGAY